MNAHAQSADVDEGPYQNLDSLLRLILQHGRLEETNTGKPV